ncbi:MAG: SCP2 sterol-binding domain-containing protein [Lachnospiraceae bacterium]|nr:SCP2 sterol-binding domain-containing protein [Lachnospiraceae bacterium]
MTYEEMVKVVKENAAKVSQEDITGHIAVQFNIEGEAEGAFYVEFNSGKITVEPYEYFDRDILICCTMEQAIGMSLVTYDPVKAYKNGEIYVEGNIGRLELLKEMLKKSKRSAEEKAAAKKAAEKKKSKASKKSSSDKKSNKGKKA